jgi:hypothetical protein
MIHRKVQFLSAVSIIFSPTPYLLSKDIGRPLKTESFFQFFSNISIF